MLRKALAVLVPLTVASGACSGPPELAPIGADAGATVETVPPAVYVAKVKNVLAGLAPTDDELRAVAADPAALGTLVDGWMKLPQYEEKMMRFFELAYVEFDNYPNHFYGKTESY